LEAAAVEGLLITTNTVGCRKIVEEGVNGLLVPVKDATALARAMIRMLKDPAMRVRIGKAGRKKMERDLDERLVFEKIWHIYTEGTL
jgi:glycosyltransferase involved in cell wall biosynthesis